MDGDKHVVKCKECGEVITAKRGDYLVKKKAVHKKECHTGFEDVHHDV